jgi:hypothetical protein
MSDLAAWVGSPFPGMDPYLEDPDLWPDFHDRLAGVISAQLNALLPPQFYSRFQKRSELGVVVEAGTLRRIIPDVTLLRQVLHEPVPSYAMTGVSSIALPRTQATPGIELRIRTDPFQHRFVEIRDARSGHKVVTVLEIVSPSNKLPGPDRRSYEAKQLEVLNTDANLIELDLLRTGRRLLPYPELAATVDAMDSDYLVLLNRSALREGLWMDYTLYPTGVRDPLPCIPVPLSGQTPDVLLDLQVAANRAYVEGPYRRIVDYTVEPEPPLRSKDASWANQLLAADGLR